MRRLSRVNIGSQLYLEKRFTANCKTHYSKSPFRTEHWFLILKLHPCFLSYDFLLPALFFAAWFIVCIVAYNTVTFEWILILFFSSRTTTLSTQSVICTSPGGEWLFPTSSIRVQGSLTQWKAPTAVSFIPWPDEDTSSFEGQGVIPMFFQNKWSHICSIILALTETWCHDL